jgi:Dolichyl-phosphate-mannose-protein mannosyltransferase/SEC-C motif
MQTSPQSSYLHYVLAATLIVIFMAQSFSASLKKSPVFDEPPHIASGLSYLETGVFHANLQHPPLLKEISAAFLAMAGIHWPKSPLADAVIRGGPQGEKMEWPVGNNIIHDNGADRVLFWGRLPFVLLGGLLGALIFWWGRELVGSPAALAALFLYAFDPTIIAHSALVTTDTGVTAFTMLFLFALWRYVQRPNWKRLVLGGLSLGAVLGAKFSAVFLLPVAAILLAAAALWPVAGEAETDAAPAERRYAKVGSNSPCPCGSGKKYKRCHGAGAAPGNVEQSLRQHRLTRAAVMFAAMCGIAVVVIEALYFFPSDPFLYLTGLRSVNADHVAGYSAYLHGDLAPHFLSYFGIAFLVKEPLATVLLSIAGLVILVRNKSVPLLTKLFLLVAPVVLFVAVSLLADDMGIRYIIPTLPFAYLLAGLALARLFDKRLVWGRYVAAALCLWVLVEAVGIYPDHLSYFNESACLLESPGNIGLDGGSRCGPLWLDDSNVDWGQGLKQLRTWVNRYGYGRTVHLAYFGEYPPEGYDFKFQNLNPNDMFAPPPPGLYAVSAHLVARLPASGTAVLPGAAGWLRDPPSAIVGHAFYIYEIK